MLSIIICTREAASLAAVSESVAATIGVSYEIVAIDNSQGQYGICEAYNVGAGRAQYGLLCFMHEDIRLHTVGWGVTVAEILRDPTIGVVGVTGGQYQLAVPAPWWGCGLALCRENVLNVFADGHTELELRNPEQQLLADVAVVDGMWLCSRKEVWQRYPFDARTFTDFHFYDVDYCTELFLRGLRVCVTFELLLEHHSRGSLNAAWVRNALKYQQKRQGQLPFGPVSLPPAKRQELERRALQEFINRLIEGGSAVSLVLKYWSDTLRRGPFDRDTWWLAKRWLLQRGAAPKT